MTTKYTAGVCKKFAKQMGLDVSGNKAGIAVADKNSTWVTAFSSWQEFGEFLAKQKYALLNGKPAEWQTRKNAIKPARRTIGMASQRAHTDKKTGKTTKKPSARLMQRRAKDDVPGYYPNPAKRYYCVDTVKGGLWDQVAFFATKAAAFEYARAAEKAKGGVWRVVFTYPSSK